MKIPHLFRSKPGRTAIVISGLWLGSAALSFGEVTIGLAYDDSTNPDCNGHVQVEGTVKCNPCDGHPPKVKITDELQGSKDKPTDTNGTVTPNNPACVNNVWSGRWGPTTVTLKKGVNVLTAVDSCKGTSDGLSVISSGTNGASFEIKLLPGCPLQPGTCGVWVLFKFCCLKEGHRYNWHEVVTTGACTTSCAAGNDSSFQATGTCYGYASNTEPGVSDSAQGPCPSRNIAFDCICNQMWTLTDVNTGKEVASGKTTRHSVSTLDPPSTKSKLAVTVSGNGIKGSGGFGCVGGP